MLLMVHSMGYHLVNMAYIFMNSEISQMGILGIHLLVSFFKTFSFSTIPAYFYLHFTFFTPFSLLFFFAI